MHHKHTKVKIGSQNVIDHKFCAIHGIFVFISRVLRSNGKHTQQCYISNAIDSLIVT